jgi:hypothetical protein
MIKARNRELTFLSGWNMMNLSLTFTTAPLVFVGDTEGSVYIDPLNPE